MCFGHLLRVTSAVSGQLKDINPMQTMHMNILVERLGDSSPLHPLDLFQDILEIIPFCTSICISSRGSVLLSPPTIGDNEIKDPIRSSHHSPCSHFIARNEGFVTQLVS